MSTWVHQTLTKVQSSKQFDLVVKAFDPDVHFADQMIQAFTIYIKMIDAAPTYARAFTTAVEVFTPRVREVFEENRAAYCAALKTWFLEVRRQYPEVGECGDHLFNMLAAAICAFASERVQTRVLEAEEAGVALTQVGLGMLRLYGWAQRCARRPSEHVWGDPLR